jgi:hypothetical protein
MLQSKIFKRVRNEINNIIDEDDINEEDKKYCDKKLISKSIFFSKSVNIFI